MTDIRWPNGARLAVAFTFDFDAEGSLSQGREASLSQVAEAAYGPRVGVPLILDVLHRQGIRATFFVPGADIELHRQLLEQVVAAGHELAMHGHRHAAPDSLSAEQEAVEFERARESLAKVTRVIQGYRAPGLRVTDRTVGILEAAGIRYSSNLMADVRPYRHSGRRLIEIPVHWTLDDWPHFGWSPETPSASMRTTDEVLTQWTAELHGIRRLGGSFVPIMHPSIIGRPSRVEMIDRLADGVAAVGDAWIATCAEIAAHVDGQLKADDARQDG